MEIKAGNARGGEGGSIGLLSGSSKGLQSGKCSRVQTWRLGRSVLTLLFFFPRNYRNRYCERKRWRGVGGYEADHRILSGP